MVVVNDLVNRTPVLDVIPHVTGYDSVSTDVSSQPIESQDPPLDAATTIYGRPTSPLPRFGVGCRRMGYETPRCRYTDGQQQTG